ncbi:MULTISPECIES: hypothetical protein [unclassified Microbacterium]|uniref:hypothetical protein n=1 Tax=unclassified Microbacterium TaxID=2609290 RepID=UPI0004935352|nr:MULTISPECIES: hypothetical protein [unclassified Microbacterium]
MSITAPKTRRPAPIERIATEPTGVSAGLRQNGTVLVAFARSVIARAVRKRIEPARERSTPNTFVPRTYQGRHSSRGATIAAGGAIALVVLNARVPLGAPPRAR